MLQIMRHSDLYHDPVAFVQNVVGVEWCQSHGKKPVFLFPTQTLLEFWEEQLLPVIGSWGGTRFLLFDALVREILDETRPELIDLTLGSSVLLLRFVVQELAQQGLIPYLAQAFPSASFYTALRQELLLLKRAALDPPVFFKMVKGGSQPLQELALVYDRFQQCLNQRQLADAEEKIRLATVDSVHATCWQRLEHLWVIGFTDFTPQQEAFLHQIGNLIPVTVVFDHGPAKRNGILLPAMRTPVRQEKVLISSAGPDKAASSGLNYLQAALWAPESLLPPAASDDSLELFKVKGGSRYEIAAIAVAIKDLLATDPTLTADQIGIITVYPLEQVHQILASYDLPVTVNLRRPIGEEPAAKALLQPLETVLSDYEWAEMIKFLRIGGIIPEEELYGVDPPTTFAQWQRTLTNLAATAEQKALIHALLSCLDRLPRQGTYTQFFQASLAWLDHPCLLKSFLPMNRTPEPYLHARYYQTAVLGKLRGLLQKALALATAVQTPEVSLHEFYLTLEAILALESSQKPTSWASGVRLLTPEEARGVAFRVTFVAGLNEGAMPHLTPGGWLLQEETTQKWPTRYRFPTNVEQLLRERLLFFYVVNTAREKLVLSCCQTSAEGDTLNPSSFWEDVDRLLPAGQYRKEVKVDQLRMARQMAKYPADLDSEIRQKIRGELARRQSNTNGQLGPEAATLLQSIWTVKPLSISALESYGICPFSYFCRYWLQIKPLAEPEIIPSRLTEGSIAHLILREFFLQRRGEVLQRNRLSTYTEEIRALVEQYYPQDHETSMLRHNLLVLGRENLVSTLTKVLQEEVDWGEKTDGRFTPRYLELGFGGITEEADAQSTPAPLVLSIEHASPDQPPLKLWGKIDRVDTDGAGNFVVYDYKSGKAPTKAEITTGKRLQLPFYLLAVLQLFRPGGKPVGAAYYSLRQADRFRGIWHQEALDFGINIKGALSDEEWEAILGNAFSVAFRSYYGMLKGNFPFCPPDQCPHYCVYQPICHHLSWGGEDEDEAE